MRAFASMALPLLAAEAVRVGMRGTAVRGAGATIHTAATASVADSATQALQHTRKESPKEILDEIAGGTGIQPGTTGSQTEDRILMKRMSAQDTIVLLVLIGVYGAALVLGWVVVYRLLALRETPVLLFSDKAHSFISAPHKLTPLTGKLAIPNVLATDSAEVGSFVETFLLKPPTTRLEVIGLAREGTPGFHFALDISEHCQIQRVSTEPEAAASAAQSYLSPSATNEIRRFIQSDNSLARLEIEKTVSWPEWERLKSLIQRQVRMCGFAGEVHVQLRDTEQLTVSKNDTWARFASHKTTNALCGLSIVGLCVWPAYRWMRSKVFVLKAQYEITQDPVDFFAQVQDRLGTHGFE